MIDYCTCPASRISVITMTRTSSMINIFFYKNEGECANRVNQRLTVMLHVPRSGFPYYNLTPSWRGPLSVTRERTEQLCGLEPWAPPPVPRTLKCPIYVICACLCKVVSNTYCVVFLFCLFSYLTLSVFLDCTFLIAPSVFSNVYLKSQIYSQQML